MAVDVETTLLTPFGFMYTFRCVPAALTASSSRLGITLDVRLIPVWLAALILLTPLHGGRALWRC
jgi:hypothetical protein